MGLYKKGPTQSQANHRSYLRQDSQFYLQAVARFHSADF